MLKFLLLVFFCALGLGSFIPEDDRAFMDIYRDSRIIGGEEASIEDAPYQVAMLLSSGSSFIQYCGGSIVKPNVIVSASHCPEGTTAARWRVRAGSAQSLSGGQVVDVASFVMHEIYGTVADSRWDYDVGLYITSSPLTLNGDTIAAIGLPAQDQALADGTVGLITGWGSTREGGSTVANLRKASIAVVNQQKCSESYVNNRVTERMICLGDFDNGGVDACQGDSGGPFAVGNELIGITSWGNGCARPRYPGLYTRVASFRDWIDEKSP